MSPPPKYCDNCHPPQSIGGGVTIVTPPKVLHRGGGDNCHPPQSIAQGGGVTIVTPPKVLHRGGGG